MQVNTKPQVYKFGCGCIAEISWLRIMLPSTKVVMVDINVKKSVNFADHFSSRFFQNDKNINLTGESFCSENSN